MHNLKDSSENYLEAIYILTNTKGHVRSVDIANYLDLSRPSVSKAMKKLVEEGSIEMMENGQIILTPLGARVGEEINDRHQFLKRMLISVGVSEAVAEDDACKIEHAISRESLRQLKAHFEK
ncbi:MAG: metal-dependent transcriptional regulator [Ndongobacter sp.]|nr:metal-dependent transcriptional regulator [Ndongobacter sp.]